MTLSKQTPDRELPDIRVPLDTVCFIISKAREFTIAGESTELDPPRIDDDDVETAVMEDRPTDSVEAEMISFISDLNDGAQIDLVAIMWLGREEGPDDWAEAQQIATEEHNDHTAAYLCGTPLLASYLEDGLAAIGRDCDAYSETMV